jgi:hypothetical protein
VTIPEETPPVNCSPVKRRDFHPNALHLRCAAWIYDAVTVTLKARRRNDSFMNKLRAIYK